MNIHTQRSQQRKIRMAQRLTIVSLSIPLSLSIAGCGGEELLDILDAATGDGGKRVRLNGPIMGENRLICINNPPKIPPAALQQEIDKYLFKAI
ncbi:hypothetical protein SAMN02745117_00319 [Lampropedia hyalina DSM 16112]|jgi:hypothetical protein|uniref:Uncharacterized protein n=1 Tax=Lampropedia hyalina DSM 16112 TaxID=1122156 RepID=A0A1M4TPV9_9BURK|nr:hypothetical protein [Lampropedia hyalina]SHE46434.1 hypothetical protein SAMN02745117_00319 [Lampropedia hyalina DSM 16112]